VITRLKGIVLEKQPTEVVLDVHGVGYRLFVPLSVFAVLPDVGQEAVLHTHFVVREDAQHLYGFIDRDERRLFQALIKVNGVGPRLGLAILSGMEMSAFVQSIHDGDTASLVRLPGVGKKTAERLIVEMRDRLKDWSVGDVPHAPSATGAASHARHEAEGALVALGYKPAQAEQAVKAALKAQPDLAIEELIRQALKRMVG
jgi:Holliday junction DNA helicase RuvA